MRLLSFLLLITAVCLSACSSKLETVESTDEYGYIVKYTRSKDDFAKQGLYTRLGKDGKKMEEANYVNDTLHGPRTLFYPNGQAEIIEQYHKGQFAGIFKTFHESGKIKLEGEYINGVMQGQWKGYYESGQLKETVQFESNEENGPFVEYYDNGNLKAEGAYLNGDNEHGELKLYDENGQLNKKMNCKMGVCRTTWTIQDSTQTKKM